MEPISTVIAAAIGIIKTVVGKDVKEVATKAATSLWNFIKNKFTGNEEKPVIKKVEDNNYDEASLKDLTDKLEQKAKADMQFQQELRKEVDTANSIIAGINISVKGNKNIVVGSAPGSNFTIN